MTNVHFSIDKRDETWYNNYIMTNGQFIKEVFMASETVKMVLDAEAESDKKVAEARAKCDEIISSAEQKAALAVQKKITDATIQADKIRAENKKRLEEYTASALERCEDEISALKKLAADNSEKAADAVISRFFS